MGALDQIFAELREGFNAKDLDELEWAMNVEYIEPLDDGNYEFVDSTKGGVIPKDYIPSVDKGFRMAMEKGPTVGFPIIGVRAVVNDGSTHPVDSSDMAFQAAAIGAFREAYRKSKPRVLEPIMKVVVEGPTEFQGSAFASINVMVEAHEGGDTAILGQTAHRFKGSSLQVGARRLAALCQELHAVADGRAQGDRGALLKLLQCELRRALEALERL